MICLAYQIAERALDLFTKLSQQTTFFFMHIHQPSLNVLWQMNNSFCWLVNFTAYFLCKIIGVFLWLAIIFRPTVPFSDVPNEILFPICPPEDATCSELFSKSHSSSKHQELILPERSKKKNVQVWQKPHHYFRGMLEPLLWSTHQD